MIDILGIQEPEQLSAADFRFKVGNDNDPTGWREAPEPTSVTVRPGAGTHGSDRVTLI